MVGEWTGKLDAIQLLILLITLAALAVGGLTAVVWIVTSQTRRWLTDRAGYVLAREMLGHGMSADDVATVLASLRGQPEAVAEDAEEAEDEEPAEDGEGDEEEDSDEEEVPRPCEVALERDGEWVDGLVIGRSDDRFCVYEVGTDLADSEWVGRDRIRFNAEAFTESGELIDFPLAREVLVSVDGEWSPALLLAERDDWLYVHVIGQDAEDDDWVELSRVRFPAQSALRPPVPLEGQTA